MSPRQKLFVLLVVSAICVGCDQATKRLAEFALKQLPPMSFFGNFFRLEYAENPGAFLGMGGNLPDWERWLLLTVISSAILVALAAFVCFRSQLLRLELYGYAFIFAGGTSNMIDRIMAGVVIDFMNVGIGTLRTGIFNIADIFIMTGLFLVTAAQIRPLRKPQPVTVSKSCSKEFEEL